MDSKMKVCRVVNNKELIITLNGNEFRKGDKVLIYSLGEEVLDPDTKESLGKLEKVKGVGEISHLQEKIATITAEKIINYKTSKKTTKNGMGLFLLSPIEYETKEKEEIQTEFKNPIIGDLVKKYY